MKKNITALIIILASILLFVSCSKTNKNSTFSITFIDVGQGDAALVECDRHYMLIDGGNQSAGQTVYDVLKEKGIQKLDILAISHLHEDHFGGLIKALTFASSIKKTLCNTDSGNSKLFSELEHQLSINGGKITVPRIGEKYKLGSAEIEVIDVASEDENDSLVLLLTYGKTKFLFTGDAGIKQQEKIADKYDNTSDDAYQIDLIKMPHHGAYSRTLYRFIRTFMPDYVVISVGAHNIYGHPDNKTLEMLDSKTYKPKIYRTDTDGNIIVKSDGKELLVETK